MLKIILTLSLIILSCSQRSQDSGSDVASSSTREGIYNGQILLRTGEFPASRTVVLLQQRKNGVPSGFCTAVLIGQHTGLTAAHCLQGSDQPGSSFEVLFGLSQWDTRGLTVPGKSFRIHPQFGTQQVVYTYTFAPGQSKTVTLDKRFDVAIFSFASNLPPAYLPATVYSQPDDLSGLEIYLYGAGHSEYVDAASYGTTQYQSGEFGFLRRGIAQISQGYLNYPDFYVTDASSESHVCRGDSGGPDFLANAKNPTVVGLHSSMIVNDLNGQNIDSMCGHTAIMTKLSAVYPWIAQQKQILESEVK